MKHCLPVVLTGLMASLSLMAEESHIAKARFLLQTSAAAPAPVASNGFGFEASLVVTAPGFETITSPQLKLPGGSSQNFTLNATGDVFNIQAGFDSLAALEAAYPAGNYAFTGTDSVFSSFNTTLALPATAFPVAPQIANFTESQAVDASQNFDVTWAAFTGADPDQDYINFTIVDDQGNSVLDQEQLSATETSATIPSEELAPGKTYHGTLSFIHVAGAAFTGFPFPKAGFASETQFTVQAKTSGGTVDTTPPSLTQSVPETGTTLISQYQGAAFLFSEPMDQSKIGIAWSATLNDQPYPLDPAKFQTFWDSEGKTLAVNYGITSGGWPNGLTVMWTLRPDPNAANAFRDLAGNVLDASYSGSFYTVGGTPGCTGEDPVEAAAFGVFKLGSHLQTGPGAATDTPAEGGGMFLSFFGKAVVGNITLNPTITLEFPAPPAPLPHQLKAFSQLAVGFSVFSQNFATQADLDQNYPAGTYALEIRNLLNPVNQQVTNSVVFDLGTSGYPVIPHFANYAAAQAVDPNADFTLQWDAFTGNNAASAIGLKIEDADGKQIFSAPNTCGGLPLAPTALSIKIPTNTLAAGKTYKVTLSFQQAVEQGKTMPNVPGKGVAVLGSATEMTLKTIGGTVVTAPVFRSIATAGTGNLTLVVDCTVGATLTIKSAATLDGPFSVNLLTTNPPVSPISLTLPVSGSAQGFLRAESN